MKNDLISREALKEAMRKAKRGHYAAFSDVTLQGIYRVIDNAPTVEKPHGKWVEGKVAFYNVCSICGAVVTNNPDKIYLNEFPVSRIDTINFCPNCGAKMYGGKEE